MQFLWGFSSAAAAHNVKAEYEKHEGYTDWLSLLYDFYALLESLPDILLCHLVVRGIWMKTNCAFLSLASSECVAVIAHLFLRMDEPSKGLFRPRNQSSRRRDYCHLSLSLLFRSKCKELRFILECLEVGIVCISAQENLYEIYTHLSITS